MGVAHEARLKREDTVALAMLGDGATSEGTRTSRSTSRRWKAPVVFLVQNNGYAISVPLAKQTAAPTLGTRASGTASPASGSTATTRHAVYAAVRRAVVSAAEGGGPVLIEALTRVEAHTNADDATRYRSQEEVDSWVPRDPLTRLRRYLTGRGLLGDQAASRAGGRGRDRCGGAAGTDERRFRA